MCFLALIFRTVPHYPLLVGANRDEYLDRGGTGPFEIRPGIWGGQDPRASGTWLGVNRNGLIAGITNRHGALAPHNPQARSRGLLCLDVLGLDRAQSVPGWLGQAIARYPYNEFNLVAADRDAALAISLRGGTLQVRALEPGLHVVANSEPDSLDDRKVVWGTKRLREEGFEPPSPAGSGGQDIDAILERLGEVCRDHGPSGALEDSICVHGPQHGTLSSTLIAVHEKHVMGSRYLFADGHPCETPYRDVSQLLKG